MRHILDMLMEARGYGVCVWGGGHDARRACFQLYFDCLKHVDGCTELLVNQCVRNAFHGVPRV